MQAPNNIRLVLAGGLGMIMFGLVAYSNSWHVPFVFDDHRAIITNTAITNFDIPAIWHSHSTRFVPYLTFALNYWLHGLNVPGYHVVNFILHALVAFVAAWTGYRLSTRLQPTVTYAFKETKVTNHVLLGFVVGSLFMVHPLQTQAVTYIVQRITIITALFYLTTTALYLEARLRKSVRLYALACISALAAAFSKEIAVTLPLILLVFEFVTPRATLRSWRGSAARLLPFFLIAALIPLTLSFTRGTLYSVSPPQIAAVADVPALPTGEALLAPPTYFLTQLNVLRSYLRLLILPVQQNLDYDYPISTTLFELRTLASALLVLFFMGCAIAARKRLPLVTFGILFFFVALMLESSFFPLEDVIFEHRLYLPSFGFFMTIAGIITAFPTRKLHYALIGLLLLVVPLSYLTWQRNTVWASELSLWQDVGRKSPNKARVHANIGTALVQTGDLTGAQEAFRTVVDLDPAYTPALNNLGLIALQENQPDGAITYFQRALAIDPDSVPAHANLGVTYAQLGNDALAQQEYEAALALNPAFSNARYNLALLHIRQQNYAAAYEALQTLLSYDRNHTAAQAKLQMLPTR